jgi:hypothetical protein
MTDTTHPDAALLGLAVQAQGLFDRLSRDVLRRAKTIRKEEVDAACAQLADDIVPIANAALSMRATTLDGLIAKARIAAGFAGQVEPTLAEAIVRDLVAIGAAAEALVDG